MWCMDMIVFLFYLKTNISKCRILKFLKSAIMQLMDLLILFFILKQVFLRRLKLIYQAKF